MLELSISGDVVQEDDNEPFLIDGIDDETISPDGDKMLGCKLGIGTIEDNTSLDDMPLDEEGSFDGNGSILDNELEDESWLFVIDSRLNDRKFDKDKVLEDELFDCDRALDKDDTTLDDSPHDKDAPLDEDGMLDNGLEDNV